MACLLVILVIVIAVILLAVSVGVYRRGYDS